MAQRVNIQGVGPVDFPDGMSQAAMAHAIETELMPTLQSRSTPDASLPSAAPRVAQPPSAPEPDANATEMPVSYQGNQAPGGAWAGFAQGVHDVAHGAAGLAAFPFAATTALVTNPAIYGANKLLGTNFPLVSSPTQTANHAVSSALEGVGVPQIPEDQKPTPNKLVSNINEIGTQTVAAWPMLLRAAGARGAELAAEKVFPRAGDAMLQPYAANPVAQTMGQDLPAAAGAATGLTATQELMTPEYRKAHPIQAALADLAAMAVGATGLATGAKVATGGTSVLGDAVRGRMTDNSIPLDPDTKIATQNKTADKAAVFLQSQAENPAAAANTIRDEAAWFRGNDLPLPTTGALSGDRGLQGVENSVRTAQGTGSLVQSPGAADTVKQKYSFGARDAALKDAAGAEIKSMAPAEADANAFTKEAQNVADQRIRQAEGNVQLSQGMLDALNTQRQTEGAQLAVERGNEANASSRLHREIVDKSLVPMTDTKNANFKAIDPKGDIQRDVAPLAAKVDDIRKATANMLPSVRNDILPEKLMQDIENLAPKIESQPSKVLDASGAPVMRDVNVGGEGKVSFKGLNDMIPQLSAAETKARLAGDLGLVDNIRALRQEMAKEADRLAAEGGEAGNRAQAALGYYKDEFAPVWAAGPGDAATQFRKARNQDVAGETRVPASQTASAFLQPGQVEKAQSLGRVIESIPDPAAAAKASRDYLIADMAKQGVTSDGKLNTQQLKAWRDSWGPVLDAVPGVRDEVNALVDRAARGSASAKQFEAELNAAQKNLKLTQAQINDGALGLVLGKEPQKAVAAVFASGNPVQSMKEIAATVSGNKAAADGLKKAVSDFFERKVTDVSVAGLENGTEAPNFARLTKQWNANREVLAQVFTPAEMNAAQRAQRVLEPLVQKAYQATVGSPTSERNARLERSIEVGLKLYYGMLKGGGLFRTFKLAKNAVMGEGEADISRLVARTMFDPDLAGALLTRNVKEAGTTSWNKNLQRVIRLNVAGQDMQKEPGG